MTIRENLLVLIAAVEAEPEPLFALSAFEQTGKCGTLHCTLGLACTLPHFYELGLEMEARVGIYGAYPKYLGVGLWQVGGFAKINQLFGEESYSRLFDSFHNGLWDGELLEEKAMSDKELAIARLNKQLELYP